MPSTKPRRTSQPKIPRRAEICAKFIHTFHVHAFIIYDNIVGFDERRPPSPNRPQPPSNLTEAVAIRILEMPLHDATINVCVSYKYVLDALRQFSKRLQTQLVGTLKTLNMQEIR